MCVCVCACVFEYVFMCVCLCACVSVSMCVCVRVKQPIHVSTYWLATVTNHLVVSCLVRNFANYLRRQLQL